MIHYIWKIIQGLVPDIDLTYAPSNNVIKGTVCMNVKKTPAYFHLRDRCCMVEKLNKITMV